jgi:transposase InsO family protein
VRYGILRLRLQHPHWGPNRIRFHLSKRASLRGLALPGESSIGRYLHQWLQFRRQRKPSPPAQRPLPAQEVHQRWQLDFKLGIVLQDGTLVNLHTVRDPVGEVCLGAFVFPAGRVGQLPKRATFDQVQQVLRRCFARWHTWPQEVQTDGEGLLIGRVRDPFPSLFTLWLRGLGIQHLVSRPGRPTDNAEVERCHRIICDYAIVGQEATSPEQLQSLLNQAVLELAYELPSQAAGCQGRPPVVAHPEILQPTRRYQSEHEAAMFDLQRVDQYLATFLWERLVSKSGQITLGGSHQYYTVGRAYARQSVLVRFDPTDRHFVFYHPDTPQTKIRRRPARGLDAATLQGTASWPDGLGIQQLPLPLLIPEG